MAKLTPRLRIVVSRTGSSQLGLRTMSSKVAFGEKKTPITRPNGLTAACGCAWASGIGVGVVAIGTPPPQDVHIQVHARGTHGNRRKFQRRDCSADRDQGTGIEDPVRTSSCSP